MQRQNGWIWCPIKSQLVKNNPQTETKQALQEELNSHQSYRVDLQLKHILVTNLSSARFVDLRVLTHLYTSSSLSLDNRFFILNNCVICMYIV
jgi:hypothetical protein